jgi:hypothetical protein
LIVILSLNLTFVLVLILILVLMLIFENALYIASYAFRTWKTFAAGFSGPATLASLSGSRRWFFYFVVLPGVTAKGITDLLDLFCIDLTGVMLYLRANFRSQFEHGKA